MNRDSVLVNNTIIDSNSEGIYISAPSFHNVIANNFINNTHSAGIIVSNEMEHKLFQYMNTTKNLTIINNTISNSLTGIIISGS